MDASVISVSSMPIYRYSESMYSTVPVVLCVEHGTNLAGASPVMGIYSQV